MFRLGIGMVLILLAQGFAVLCGAAELDLPSLEAHGKTYSNVTVSSTSRNRVVVRYAGGLITLNASDLNDETRRQLIQAGMIEDPSVVSAAKKGKEKTGFFSGGLAKKPPTKADEAKKSQAKESQTNEDHTKDTATDAVEDDTKNESFATQLGSKFQSEARSRSGVSPEKLLSMLSLGIVLGVCAVAFGLYLLRCWCLFRICRKGRGNGSLLVFLPLLRWFPLAEAAGMKRSLLWIPVFAMVGLYLPPPMPQVQGFTLGYGCVVATLWLTTALLFAIWCVKICKQLECSSFFALLLLLPVLDWVALLYLAFSGEKVELAKGSGPNRMVLAI